MLEVSTSVSVRFHLSTVEAPSSDMKTFAVCLVAAAIVAVHADAPGGYSYSRPSGGGGGGGYSGGGGGYSGGGGGGGGYVPVPVSGNTNEGQYVDQQLLGQIRQIILQHESQSGGGGGGGYSGGGGISSSYGVPSSSYGVPSGGGGRVIGVDLGQVEQAIQVAQYEQTSGGGGGGYPSSSYGAPSRPSSSYGAPF